MGGRWLIDLLFIAATAGVVVGAWLHLRYRLRKIDKEYDDAAKELIKTYDISDLLRWASKP